MRPGDHSLALERIARDCNQSPLVVLELFLERASIREYEGGHPRPEAERLALQDTRDALDLIARRDAAGSGLPSERAACDADATGMHPQNDGRRDSVASGRVS